MNEERQHVRGLLVHGDPQSDSEKGRDSSYREKALEETGYGGTTELTTMLEDHSGGA